MIIMVSSGYLVGNKKYLSKDNHTADLKADSPRCSAIEISCHSVMEAVTAFLTLSGIQPTWAYLASGSKFGLLPHTVMNCKKIDRNWLVKAWHSMLVDLFGPLSCNKY